jgi:hypothetical protein
MPSPKLIHLFLPDGNPNGIKIAEIANRNIRAILIPRPILAEIKSYAELSQPALYALTDREGERIYIGECESFTQRVKDHVQKKDFWEIAIVFVTNDNSIDKAEVKFLESLAVEAAKEAGRMKIENQASPTRNTLHQFKAQTILEFFDDITLLISTLGYPVFDRIKVDDVREDQMWYWKNNKASVKALYNEQGFTILKGGLVVLTAWPSFEKHYPVRAAARNELIQKMGTLIDPNSHLYEITENITFTSPNQASVFCAGGSVNAWVFWRNKAGQTMDEVLRA